MCAHLAFMDSINCKSFIEVIETKWEFNAPAFLLPIALWKLQFTNSACNQLPNAEQVHQGYNFFILAAIKFCENQNSQKL
jgi:hypothetical protein